MSHTQGQRIAWTVPEGRDNDCWDPYFVWALTTGRLPEDDDRPYLVQRISDSGETAFSTEMARLSDGSPGFVDEKNVVRWQLGAPRNASYINLSDYADVEVRPTHTDVIAAVLDDGCPLLNKAFRDADGTRVRRGHAVRVGQKPETAGGISRIRHFRLDKRQPMARSSRRPRWTSFLRGSRSEATPSSVSRTALCGIWKRQKSDGTVPVS